MAIWDLSTKNLVSLRMGRIQCVHTQYIRAGDTYEADFTGSAWQISPLRHRLQYKVQMDICAFFVPYRYHIPGWVEAAEKLDPSLLGTIGHTTISGADYYTLLGLHNISGVSGIPTWRRDMVLSIYNHYYRHPLHQAEKTTITADEAVHGFVGNNVKSMHTALIYDDPADSDYQVSVTNGKLDLRDLREGGVDTEVTLDQHYRQIRYRDYMEQIYGGHAVEDADKRPHWLAHNTFYMDSREVVGTSGSNFGQAAARGGDVNGLRVPRKTFGEHGIIFIMALPRWPAIWEDMINPLDYYTSWLTKGNVTAYNALMGDPRHQPERPANMYANIMFGSNNSNVQLGTMPYLDWYREAVPRVHPVYFDQDKGFPIQSSSGVTADKLLQCPHLAWDKVFQSKRLGHIYGQFVARQSVANNLGDGGASVYAAANT